MHPFETFSKSVHPSSPFLNPCLEVISVQYKQMATEKNPKISLKLLIDKSSRKVIFAEAKKDFVDFLFGLMEIPMGTILALLVRRGVARSARSWGRIYESIKNLDDDYLQQPSQGKDSLLMPKMALSNTKHAPLLAQLAYPNQPEFIWETPAPVATEGYVKEGMTYIVKDDLTVIPTVKPISTISTITLLKTLEVTTNLSCLQEMTVEVDFDKVGLLFFIFFLLHDFVFADLC
ncbi:hypothetical protein U1Q18_033305 [Sarracenia purpurea var. burkii]